MFIKVSVPAFRNTYRVSGFGTFGAPGDVVTEDEEEEKERERKKGMKKEKKEKNDEKDERMKIIGNMQQ